MYRRDFSTRRGGTPSPPRPGIGVPCRDAQADGIPCGAIRVRCEECERLRAQRPGSWSVREVLPGRPANDA